jgi:hypothetical protein
LNISIIYLRKGQQPEEYVFFVVVGSEGLTEYVFAVHLGYLKDTFYMLGGKVLDGVDAVAVKAERFQGNQAGLLLLDHPIVQVQVGEAAKPALL